MILVFFDILLNIIWGMRWGIGGGAGLISGSSLMQCSEWSMAELFVGGGQLVLKHYKSWGKLWEFGRCVVVILRQAPFFILYPPYTNWHIIHSRKMAVIGRGNPTCGGKGSLLWFWRSPNFRNILLWLMYHFANKIHQPAQQTQNLYHQIHVTVLFWNLS